MEVVASAEAAAHTHCAPIGFADTASASFASPVQD